MINNLLSGAFYRSPKRENRGFSPFQNRGLKPWVLPKPWVPPKPWDPKPRVPQNRGLLQNRGFFKTMGSSKPWFPTFE